MHRSLGSALLEEGQTGTRPPPSGWYSSRQCTRVLHNLEGHDPVPGEQESVPEKVKGITGELPQEENSIPLYKPRDMEAGTPGEARQFWGSEGGGHIGKLGQAMAGLKVILGRTGTNVAGIPARSVICRRTPSRGKLRPF